MAHHASDFWESQVVFRKSEELVATNPTASNLRMAIMRGQ
jgi:hypothetical protein